VVPVLAVSPAECIAALTLAGFRSYRSTSSETVLENDLRRVVVPDDAVIPKERLESILRAAGVSYSEFLELLSEAFGEEDTGHGVTDSGVRARVIIREEVG